MPRLLRFLLVTILLVTTLVIPATPSARSNPRGMLQTTAPTVPIDFEIFTSRPLEGKKRQVVDNQFTEETGVTFNDPKVFDYTHSASVGPGFTHSGDKAIQHCYGEDECQTPLILTFAPPQERVEVWFGVNHAIEDPVEVTLTAFDAELGGDVVGGESKTLTPTGEARIPIKHSLKAVSAFGNNIRRVEVGFTSPGDASWLVFDDVDFRRDETLPDTPGDATTPAACPADTQIPTLVVDRSESETSVQVNEITIEGTTTSDVPFLDATLTSQGAEGKKSMALPLSYFEANAPAFELNAREILLPGNNVMTLAIGNCAGMAVPVSFTVTYEPIPDEARYQVLGVEVTQAVQNLENSVRLIAGKRTFIRVYLQALDSASPLEQVSGLLPICRSPGDDPPACVVGDGFKWLKSDTKNTVDTLGAVTLKRQSLAGSLEFEVPLEWTTPGRLSLDLGQLTMSPDRACANCVNADGVNMLIDVAFEVAPPVQIATADVIYPLAEVEQRPSDLDWKRFRSWLERAYPTSAVRFVDDLGDLSFYTLPTCDLVNQEMFNAWVNRLNLSSTDAFEDTPVRYFALMAHPDVEGPTTIEGCAAVKDPLDDPIDGSPFDPDRFATGIAGSDWPHEWDHDGSFADFYGAHELGHIYGLLHVGKCGDEGEVDPTYTPTSGAIGEPNGDFGFDAGDASMDSDPPPPTPIAMGPYVPTTYKDMMSYCDDRWISAHSYQGILDELPAEEPDIDVEQGRGDVEGDVDGAEILDTGVEAIAADLGDLAATPPAAATPDIAAEAIAANGCIPTDLTDPTAMPAAPAGADAEVLLVLGTITLPANATPTVDFRPFSRLPGVAVTPQDPNGDFSITLKDSQGTVVANYPFTPKIYTDRLPGTDPTAQLSEVVLWDDRTTCIVITAAGQEIGERPVSANAPEVTVISPNGSETLAQPSVTVTWVAPDGDDDVLTYSLLYSADNGANWRSIASGLKEQQYTVDLANLPGSNDAIFRVIATDGVNTGQDDSDGPFQVPNNAPEVGIITPASGSSFGSAHTVVLVGRATDVEEGDLEEHSLQWSSDIQGDLGEGRSASATLLPGMHTITLTATDAAGDATSESIRVEIGDDTLPVVEWDPSKDISFFPDGLFFYGGNERRGDIYTTDGMGAIQPLHTYFTFLHEWSEIVPGHFSGEDALTDLFLYSAETGLGEFYTSDGEGGLTLLSSSKDIPDPATGWDMVVPGDFGGDDTWTDLFFYDQETGDGVFYTSDGDGQLQLLDTTPPFAETWTSIVPGNFGGNDRTDLLFYNADTGLSQFFTSDGQGCLWLLLEDPDWTPGWDQIVPGDFDGNGDWTDLFFSRDTGGKGGSSREYKFSATDGQGTIIELGQPGKLEPTWTTMIGGDFGGDDPMTDLLLYDAASGRRVFLTTDGAGGLVELSQPVTGSAGWDLIVPGRYTGAG